MDEFSIDDFPNAQSVKKKIENQKKYEITKAKEILSSLLTEIINTASDDLCTHISIPLLPSSIVESANIIGDFYLQFYFSLYHLNYEEEKAKADSRIINVDDFQLKVERGLDFYYLRYLFEDRDVALTILNLLKEKGFKAGFSLEAEGDSLEEYKEDTNNDEKTFFIISWALDS